MTRHLLLLLTILLTASCGQRYQDHSLDTAAFEQGKHALVLVSLRTPPFLKASTKVECDLVREGLSPVRTPSYGVNRKWTDHLTHPWSDACELLMIEPGIYTIENIVWELLVGNTRHIYRSSGPGLLPGGAVAYGAFKVEPGSVNYLGHLEVRMTPKRELLIERKDKFEKAKAQLAKKDPQLADKLQPATFYPAGSHLNHELFEASLLRGRHLFQQGPR